ncbi:MAG: type II secretion system F family protein [Candidatus Micrarchaeota archaeon]|nr:type II secretion system F family protein [Candidatus Micrarchaeota archaeon]
MEEIKPSIKRDETPKAGFLYGFIQYLKSRFPWLEKKMREAGMTKSVDEFVKQTIINSILLTIALTVLTAVLFMMQNINMILIIPFLIIYFLFSIFIFIQRPKAIASKRRRLIDKDLLFAGRHMWIALKGGLPLFDCIVAISKSNYGEVSKEFNKIAEKVFLGVPLDTAMQETIEDCPSPSFKRMILQIVNSIRSGADVANSLETVLDQISKEQLIEIKEYGQKLNPLVMFYLVVGIIFPSLGISIGILLLSFAGIQLTGMNVWALIPLIGIAQYSFLLYIELSRPSYEV